MRSVRNLQQKVEQLQTTLDASYQSVQQLGFETVIIHNNLDYVAEGIRAIHGFYEQVSLIPIPINLLTWRTLPIDLSDSWQLQNSARQWKCTSATILVPRRWLTDLVLCRYYLCRVFRVRQNGWQLCRPISRCSPQKPEPYGWYYVRHCMLTSSDILGTETCGLCNREMY